MTQSHQYQRLGRKGYQYLFSARPDQYFTYLFIIISIVSPMHSLCAGVMISGHWIVLTMVLHIYYHTFCMSTSSSSNVFTFLFLLIIIFDYLFGIFNISKRLLDNLLFFIFFVMMLIRRGLREGGG